MLDHNVILSSKECFLRPLLDSDEENVLKLWNQEYVVGNLFMSKTTIETYQRFFEIYKQTPDEWRWAVENRQKQFIGTFSGKIVQDSGEIGGFALFPTNDFLPVVPNILVNNFLFLEKGVKKIKFTINTENHKIRRFHSILKAVKTDFITSKQSSGGGIVVLEHWYYDKEIWLDNLDFYNSLLGEKG